MGWMYFGQAAACDSDIGLWVVIGLWVFWILLALGAGAWRLGNRR